MPNLPKPRLRRSARDRVDAHVTPPPSPEPKIEVTEYGGLRWINIDQPGPVDRAWLEEHFEFHPLEYLFERCRTEPEMREHLLSKGSGYLLYKIVDDSFDYCFPMLRKMGNKLERIEEEIFEGRSEEVVRDLSNAKQEIINFRKIIRPQRTVLRDLERNKQRYLADDLDIYFDDIVDASERIWDMLENYKEVVEALESTNESELTHRTNEVVRVLTAISVIVLPLTFMASIWGMNVSVPGESQRDAFYIVVAAMVLVLLGMVAYFRR